MCACPFMGCASRPRNAVQQYIVRGSQSVARHIRPQTRWSLDECGLVRLAAQAVQPSQNIVAYRPWSGRYAPCFSPTSPRFIRHRRCFGDVPSQFSDSLLHCGEAIGGLFLGVYKVVCFTFSGLATIYNFQCQPQTAETGYVFCSCKPDVIFEDAALRYSNKQHKIPIFLIPINPQVSLRYNKSIYRRKR